MSIYKKEFELRWSDVDANQHVTHSSYYELGAHCRMSYFLEQGFTADWFRSSDIGVILFREECVFRRELNAGEKVSVNMLLTRCRKDASRWSVRHEILKDDGSLAAVINADLAWMHAGQRKLTVPPSKIQACLNELPKSQDFQWEE